MTDEITSSSTRSAITVAARRLMAERPDLYDNVRHARLQVIKQLKTASPAFDQAALITLARVARATRSETWNASLDAAAAELGLT